MLYLVVLVFFMFFVWLSVYFLNKKIPVRPENLTDDDIKKLVSDGKKLWALKWYRELHGVSLKKANTEISKILSK